MWIILSVGGTRSKSRIPFQRSVSYQTTCPTNISTNASLPSHISVSSEDQKNAKRGGIFASFRMRSARMPPSASESSINIKPSVPIISGRNILESAKLSEVVTADSNVKFEVSDCNTETDSKESEKKTSCIDNLEGFGDDDEVFMWSMNAEWIKHFVCNTLAYVFFL